MKRTSAFALCLVLVLLVGCREDVVETRPTGTVTLFGMHPFFSNYWGLIDRNNRMVMKPEHGTLSVYGDLVVERCNMSQAEKIWTTGGVRIASGDFDRVLAGGESLIPGYFCEEGTVSRSHQYHYGETLAAIESHLPLLLADNWSDNNKDWDGIALRPNGTSVLPEGYTYQQVLMGTCLLGVRKADGKMRVFDAEGRDLGGRDFDGCRRLALARRAERYHFGFLGIAPDPDEEAPLVAMLSGGKWLVYDSDFRQLSDSGYDEVGKLSDGMLSVKLGDLWGFLDEKGLLAIAPQFGYTRSFFEGFCAVAANVLENGEIDPDAKPPTLANDGRPTHVLYGYINKKGSFFVKPKYRWAGDFEYGLAEVEPKGWAYAVKYLDPSGREFTEAEVPNRCLKPLGKSMYLDVHGLVRWKDTSKDPTNGNFNVWFDDKTGLVFAEKQTSKGILNPQGEHGWFSYFDDVKPFSDNFLIARRSDKYSFVMPDGSGNGANYERIDDLSEGLALFRMDGSCKCGYLNWSGTVKIEPDFYDGKPFSEGRAAVYKDGWGYIDTAGKWVIPPAYEDADGYIGGLASVKKDGLWGVIDLDGRLVIPFQADDPIRFVGNFAPVRCDIRGFLDLKGRRAFNPLFRGISEFDSGIAVAFCRGKAGLIDATGNWVLAPTFDSLRFVGEGLYAFSNAPLKDSYGLITKEGKIIREPSLDWAKGFSEGRLAASVGNGGKAQWGFVDRDGRWAIPPAYSWVSDFREGLAAVEVSDGHSPRRGYIGLTGRMLIPAQYSRAEDFSEGLAVVGDSGEFGYIDHTGKLVLAMKYSEASSFCHGTAKVRDGGTKLVNVRGEEIPLPAEALIQEPFPGGYKAELFEQGGRTRKFGIVGFDGKWLIQPVFRYLDTFCYRNSRYSVLHDFPLAGEKDGKPCLVAKDGKITMLDGRSVRDIGNGYFCVEIRSGYRVIDSTGREIFSSPVEISSAQVVPLPGASSKGD